MYSVHYRYPPGIASNIRTGPWPWQWPRCGRREAHRRGSRSCRPRAPGAALGKSLPAFIPDAESAIIARLSDFERDFSGWTRNGQWRGDNSPARSAAGRRFVVPGRPSGTDDPGVLRRPGELPRRAGRRRAFLAVSPRRTTRWSSMVPAVQASRTWRGDWRQLGS